MTMLIPYANPEPDPAEPIFGDKTVVLVNNATSGAVAVPTGTTQGDRLVLAIAKTEAATFTGLTRWTETVAEDSVPGAMLYMFEKEAGFTQIGDGLPVSTVTHPAIAALSSSRIAYIDGTNDELRTYDFDGETWTLTGTPLAISGSVENALCALSATRVVRIDFGAQVLQAYDLSAGAWSAVGNPFSISGTSFPALAALSSTRIAFIDGANDSLRAYDFDGTDWTLTGNAFAISGTGSPALAKLTSSRVAFIDGVHDELRAYDFSGTDWTLAGNALVLSGLSEPRLCPLSATRVILANNDDTLRCYDFDGTDWTLQGSASVAGIDYPALAALDGTTFAFIDGLADELRAYGFDLGATYTVGWTGADDAVIQMINVDQCGPSAFKATVFVGFWQTSGTGFSITAPGSPDLAALSETDVAFFDSDNKELRLYRWNSGTETWGLVGTGLSISLGTVPARAALAALNGTDIALFDNNSTATVRLYRWNEGTTAWSAVGGGTSVGTSGTPAITSLSTTDIALIDPDDKISRYHWDSGTETWSLVGAGLSITGASVPALAALNETDVALIDGSGELRLYRWNSGTETWGLVGTGLSLPGTPAIAALNTTDVVHIDSTNDKLRLYRWNEGTETWSLVGAGLSISGAGVPALATLNGTAVALVDNGTDELQRYAWISGNEDATAPTCPAVTTGSANNLVLRAFAAAGASITEDNGEPAGTTVIAVRASPNSEVSLGLAYEAAATPGDVGTGAFALTAAQPWAAATVALRAGDENPTPAETGNDANTLLLYHMDGADASTTITDSAAGASAAHTGTAVGNAQIDTAQSVFGGASLLLDGTGDSVTTADHADFDFGTGDITIDFWFRPNSLAATSYLFDWRNTGTGGAPTVYCYLGTDGSVNCALGVENLSAAAGTVTTGNWYHFAAVRSGTTTYLFIDGVQKDTDTNNGDYTATSALTWGARHNGAIALNGWLEGIRVRDLATWTANFTPPISAYGPNT
jgi:hypothetical protein